MQLQETARAPTSVTTREASHVKAAGMPEPFLNRTQNILGMSSTD
jgi:hypothetical protein